MEVDANGIEIAAFGIRNDLAQPVAGRLSLPVPFADLPGKLRPKALELLNALVDGRQMSPGQIQHMRARRAPGATQFQNLADFVEREAERLRLLNEPEFGNSSVRIASVSAL